MHEVDLFKVQSFLKRCYIWYSWDDTWIPIQIDIYDPLISCHRFKHNTSFVSRFSTIRRHRSSDKSSHGHPSPGLRVNHSSSRLAAPSSSSGDKQTQSNQQQQQSDSTGPSGTRLPTSTSSDSVAKEMCDSASKRNSDGEYHTDYILDVVSISISFLLLKFLHSLPLHPCVLLIESQGLEARISYRTSIVDVKHVFRHISFSHNRIRC